MLVFQGLNEDVRYEDKQVLTLTTLRSHDQYNTTIYGADDRYRGVFGRRDVVFLNADDLAERGLSPGDRIDLETVVGEGEAPAPGCVLKGYTAVAYDLPRGCAGAYYPEANVLIQLSQYDKRSGTPAYKSTPIRISRAAGN